MGPQQRRRCVARGGGHGQSQGRLFAGGGGGVAGAVRAAHGEAAQAGTALGQAGAVDARYTFGGTAVADLVVVIVVVVVAAAAAAGGGTSAAIATRRRRIAGAAAAASARRAAGRAGGGAAAGAAQLLAVASVARLALGRGGRLRGVASRGRGARGYWIGHCTFSPLACGRTIKRVKRMVTLEEGLGLGSRQGQAQAQAQRTCGRPEGHRRPTP